MHSRYPGEKLSIIGGGIIGAMEAYFAYLDAKKSGQQIRITIYEKNHILKDTTTGHLVPSLTPDEILAVVPKGQELIEKLKIKFTEPGGLRVDDVAGVNDSLPTKEFISQVLCNSDEAADRARIETLLALGKMSMSLWQNMYDYADAELKEILEESNFNPCREPRANDDSLHDGYRIDLFHNVPNANQKANQLIAKYTALGYQHCKVLSPKEVLAKDPFFADFCEQDSCIDELGEPQWKNDSVAVWVPGGYIDSQTFLPKFYDYLKKKMGQYLSESGDVKDCLQIRFDRNVSGVTYNDENKPTRINGIKFFNNPTVKQNVHTYENSNYVFCPGEAVGSLKKFGFREPAYAGFAGASLMLNIPIPANRYEEFAKLNNGMHFGYEDVGVAWQARFKNGKIFIGVAGTKAFYGDQKPNREQEFAQNRKVLQLNMINAVLPFFVSQALGRDTKGQILTCKDLEQLEQAGIAEHWVGVRSVAFDGFPTLGFIYNDKEKVENARCTTHLGSGGGSFSPATVLISRSIFNQQAKPDELTERVLEYGDSKRQCVR